MSTATADTKKTAPKKKQPVKKGDVPETSLPLNEEGDLDIDEVGNDDDDTEGNDDTSGEATPDEKALEVFEPMVDIKRWCIGKPPSEGGKEDEFEYYTQKPLGHVQRARFFGLVTRTLARALKEGGAIDFGFDDVLGPDGGNLRDRATAIASRDISDASSFITMIFTLASYAETFLLDCYIIWLNVPAGDRRWAKEIMSQNHDPENEEWGITDDDAIEMAERFFDQNYETMRDFFVVKIPRVAARLAAREREIQAKKENAASKA